MTLFLTGRASGRAVAAFWCVAAATLATVPGCGGCRKENPQERERQKQEEKEQAERKPPFEMRALRVEPDDGKQLISAVKPGHWVSTACTVQANYADSRLELESAAVDQEGRPFDVSGTRYQISVACPAALPKGRPRRLESTCFVPCRTDADRRMIQVRTRLETRRGGVEVGEIREGVAMMPSYQYFLVVLAASPDRYAYLRRLDSVAPPRDELSEDAPQVYYRVLSPPVGRGVPLPAQPLTWTSIAYILWDQTPPQRLTPAQQQSLLDWLHWGGGLIISGPESLDMLRGSFLDKYLPAEAAESIRLDQEALADWNRYWLPPDAALTHRHRLTIEPGRPLLGVRLKLRSGGLFTPTVGELIAERRVGGGRIAVTAFSLADSRLVHWPHFDSLFNACLLRRPRRRYRMAPEPPGAVQLDVSGREAPIQSSVVEAVWADLPALTRDARLVTPLRFFSRDIGAPLEPDRAASRTVQRARFAGSPRNVSGAADQRALDRSGPGGSSRQAASDPWRLGGRDPWSKAGIGGWNDTSGAARAARTTLKEAAGITIPKAQFVLQALAVYLIVLAPVNWGFFRLLGRVEWAWAAAPVIAVIGAVAVVRVAQLNIGFASSRTEIDVIEAQGGYPRAHLTRYMALYTSLSTPYRLTFEDPSTLALPFPADLDFRRGLHESAVPVLLRRAGEAALSGFRVRSNSTGMLHCEQMFELGGVFELVRRGGKFEVKNGARLALHDAGVLRRAESGGIEADWVGELPSGAAAPLKPAAASDGRGWLDGWDRSPALAPPSAAGGEPSLRRFLVLAVQHLPLEPGDARLVAWTDQELPGVAVSPPPAQRTTRAVVLVHLRRGPLPPPQPDVNTEDDARANPSRSYGAR